MICALQFYVGDQRKTLKLAKLLSDIEPVFREDVVLALVCQPDTLDCKDIEDTVRYCSRKFPVVFVRSEFGAKGWFDGSGQLWSGTLKYFTENDYGHKSIFTCDGGDGVPLVRKWIDKLVARHDKTIAEGKFITGIPIPWNIPQSVHANMIIDLDFVRSSPSLLKTQTTAEGAVHVFEMQHFNVLCPATSRCLEIRWSPDNDAPVSQKVLDMYAKAGMVWLHGYKDEDLVDKARSMLLGNDSLEVAGI